MNILTQQDHTAHLTPEQQKENLKLNQYELMQKYGFVMFDHIHKPNISNSSMYAEGHGHKYIFASRHGFSRWCIELGLIDIKMPQNVKDECRSEQLSDAIIKQVDELAGLFTWRMQGLVVDAYIFPEANIGLIAKNFQYNVHLGSKYGALHEIGRLKQVGINHVDWSLIPNDVRALIDEPKDAVRLMFVYAK